MPFHLLREEHGERLVSTNNFGFVRLGFERIGSEHLGPVGRLRSMSLRLERAGAEERVGPHEGLLEPVFVGKTGLNWIRPVQAAEGGPGLVVVGRSGRAMVNRVMSKVSMGGRPFKMGESRN